MSAFDEYIELVHRLGTGGINRSENDLSSNLKNALSSFGLHGVVDTGSGSNRAKRPDIGLYVDLAAADVGSAADVVIESKKPQELSRFATLSEAILDEQLWADKFIPYVRAHAERINTFILTTFERFLIVPISAETRAFVQSAEAHEESPSRAKALAGAILFDLTQKAGRVKFSEWCGTHLTQAAMAWPAPGSEDTELGVLLELEVGHGEAEVYARVQA